MLELCNNATNALCLVPRNHAPTVGFGTVYTPTLEDDRCTSLLKDRYNLSLRTPTDAIPTDASKQARKDPKASNPPSSRNAE